MNSPRQVDWKTVFDFASERVSDKRIQHCLAIIFWDLPDSGIDEALEELKAIRDHWKAIDRAKGRTPEECQHDFYQVVMTEDGVEKCRKCGILTKVDR